MINNITLNPYGLYCTFQSKKQQPVVISSNLTATFNWTNDNGDILYLKLSVVTGNANIVCEVFGDQFSGSKKYGTYNMDQSGTRTLQLNRDKLISLDKQQIKVLVKARWDNYNNGKFNFELNNTDYVSNLSGQSFINLDDSYILDGQYSDIGILYYYPELGTYTFVETPDFTIVPNTDELTKIKIYNSTSDGNLPNLKYKFNKNDLLSTYTLGTEITLNKTNSIQSSVIFKNLDTKFSDQNNIYRLSANNEINVKGKLYSLISGLEQYQEDDIGFYTFQSFFSGCPIVYSDELLIKNNTEGMYTNLFKNCSSLITAPNLQNINLLNQENVLYKQCCLSMFENCISLSSHVNVGTSDGNIICYDSCCQNMFYNCSSLINANIFYIQPANKKGYYYKNLCKQMFMNCFSLLSVQFAGDGCSDISYQSCCQSMFENCYSMTTVNKIKFNNGYQRKFTIRVQEYI